MNKPLAAVVIIFSILVAGLFIYRVANSDSGEQMISDGVPMVEESELPSPEPNSEPTPEPGMVLDRIACNTDKDGDGINDLDDFIEGARKDAKKRPAYRSNYYVGGYPPEDEGVCTDVIWRSLKNAGYDLKAMVDSDIRRNTGKYPRVEGRPDPNIDFRRVQNLKVFFKRFGKSLTTELIPNDKENLVEWQGGDIVIFEHPDHIAIISDQRRPDGIPYLIHNSGPYTREADDMLFWVSGLIGHYRYP